MTDDEMNELLEQQARAAGPRSTRPTAGIWTASSKSPPTRCACRRGTRTSSKLSGGEKRRVALCRCCCPSPDMLLLDEPTNHLDAESVAWLERFLREYPGHRRRRDPRPLLPRQRRRLDSGTGPRPRHSVRRQLSAPGWSRRKSAWSRRRDRRRPARRRSRPNWNGCAAIPRAGRPRARRACAFRGTGVQEFQKRNETNEIYIPPGPRLGEKVIEVKNVRKGYGDRLLIDDLSFQRCRAARIVGIIGPNGAGKTTLFRMITGQETPDAGDDRARRTVQLAYVDQSRDALDDKKTVWEEISDGQDIIRSASTKCRHAPMSAASISRARTSRSESATCPAANATACTWPSC